MCRLTSVEMMSLNALFLVQKFPRGSFDHFIGTSLSQKNQRIVLLKLFEYIVEPTVEPIVEPIYTYQNRIFKTSPGYARKGTPFQN